MTDRQLHVLQVTGAMNRGGTEVMLMDIYRHLSSDVRFDFLINTKKDNPRPHGAFDDEITRLGGRLMYIGTQWELGIIEYVRQFKKIAREIGKPDVVHIHLNAKCGGIALAARLCGIRKVIAHCHGVAKFRGPLRKTLPRIIELKVGRLLVALCATDFWGCSEKACEALFYRRLKAVIINNAMDVEAFQCVPEDKKAELLRSYGVNDNTLILGNTGRVVRRKELGFIIDVLHVLATRGVDFLFVCAGRVDEKDYMDEVMSKVRASQLEDRVLHLGDCEDVPALLSGFDVFVSPPRHEPFGMVAAEAQAAGLPCVLSTGFPKTVDMGLGLVMFIDNYDPEKWADAILAARGRRSFDKELIRNKITERGFDVVENTRRIERLYWQARKA